MSGDVRTDVAPMSTVDALMEFTLRLIGVWPDSSPGFLQRVLWITTLATWLCFQYWYLFRHIGTDTLPDFMHALSLTITDSLFFLKLTILWLNGSIIRDIFAAMAEDWTECASTSAKMQTMTEKAILSHRISKYTIVAYTMCVLLFGAGNALTEKSVDSEEIVGEKPLIVKMYLPFKYDVSPLYEIILITQFFMQYVFAVLVGMLNIFIIMLVLHVAGQIDIVCYELLNILIAEDESDSSMIKLRSIVSRHQRIIAFADNIEELFCYITLTHFLLSMIIICFLGFMIVVLSDSDFDDKSSLLMKIVPYYFLVNIEALIPCYIGEYLSSKSKSIYQTAYETNWYELKPTVSRILLLLMMRSQRHLTVTIGKFKDLSLECFTSIMKASASYVSVLHAMY